MSDLREQLALALWTRLLRNHPHLYRESEFPSESQYGTLWTCADECIRQMEWARSRWVAVKDSNGSTFFMPEPYQDPTVPPTIAPDDWKPTTKEKE